MRKGIFLLIVLGCLACARQGGQTDTDMMLQEIVVQNLEFVNGEGQAWDSDGSGADIIVSLTAPGETQPVFTSTVKNNIKAVDLPYSMKVSDDVDLTPKGTWTLRIMDQDDSERQSMDELSFNKKMKNDNSIEIKSNKGTATKVALVMREK